MRSVLVLAAVLCACLTCTSRPNQGEQPLSGASSKSVRQTRNKTPVSANVEVKGKVYQGIDAVLSSKTNDQQQSPQAARFDSVVTSNASTSDAKEKATNSKTTAVETETVSYWVSIANLPATRVSRVGLTGSFVVKAAIDDAKIDELVWGLSPNDCPFAPIIEADTGKITWVCWAIGECTYNVILHNHGVAYDRKPMTVKCSETRTETGRSCIIAFYT